MYSGNDTVDYPTQWALNPVAYQNMANDQVDWAALAQQWIQMKETCPPVARPVPQAPPPPPIMVLPGIEGGEAPMEVEGGDPEAPAPPSIAPQQWNNSMSDSTWGNSWNQWSGWGWPQAPNAGSKAPLMPTPEPPYSGYSTTDTNFSGYTTSNAPQPPFTTGYWTSEDGGGESRPRSSRRHSPPSVPRHISSSSSSRRPHQARVSAVPHPVPPPISVVEDTTQTIDAAKRRQLPAWIREGLEKMEREKQKQLDKEREHKEREDYLRMKRLEEERSLQDQPDDGIPRLPAKSKFDTDSEGSDVEEKIEKEGEKIDVEIKVPPPLLLKSQEEIMQDVMLTVRRTLTEILLDVTTEQILSVCKEELSRNRSQPQATRAASVASKSQALSAIGGGLGLGIYGDSSDSGSDSEDTGARTPDNRQRERSEDITDGQLQETIRRRKAEFEKTTREIEARIAEDEASLRRHRRASPGTPKSPTHRAVTKPTEQEGSTSDGEGTTTNNRKEQNNSHHKKFTNESTPPITDAKRSTFISEKIGRSERKTRDSAEKKVKIQDGVDIERKYKVSRKEPKDTKKYEKIMESPEKIKAKSPKKSKQEVNGSGSSSSDSSDSNSSDSDSFLNDSQKQKNTQSGSDSSVSTKSVSSDNSSSDSDTESVTKKQSKKKKRKSSSERRKAKKSKRDKGKTKKEDRHKSSKHEKTESDKFDLGDKTIESTLRRRDHEYSRQESVAGGSHKSSRHSTQTPERISHKSKYSQRSRSRSEEKQYKKYENRNKKYDDEGRSRDYRSRERRDKSRDRRGRSREGRGRSKDRRGRSREGRDRSRDWRDRSRDGRDRSRDGRDKSRDGRDRSRDRSKEGRGRSKDRWDRSREGRDREKEDRKDRREGRSYYY